MDESPHSASTLFANVHNKQVTKRVTIGYDIGPKSTMWGAQTGLSSVCWIVRFNSVVLFLSKVLVLFVNI